MSEPKLISPMLDGFVMGDPISDHHGVRCCPAMVKESGAKYIVKIVSVPASQVQVEALMLAGVCSNEAAAQNYFKEQAQSVVEEVDTLRKLSKLEGFIPFESCKIIPMENEIGYDVYLLGAYKRSLESYMRKHTMTHLAAVNLGLDMCASLAVCRQAGYLYVDLKPENIYISADQEYKIGDLGFIKLDSLKYASLPDKYRSAYTAPEINDAYAQINTTVDVYAAGMILFQAYNGGILPQIVPGESLVAPAFADYEMAEIILKACAPDPADRWSDPIEMGQALVSYMQRNGANNDPIVPPVVQKPKDEPEEETEPAAEPESEEVAETSEEAASEDEAVSEETQEQLSIEDFQETGESKDTEEDEGTADSDAGDIFVAEEVEDETLPDEETALDISYDEVSDDVEEILAQADSLIEHDPPAPVVAPEPIEVTLPEPEAEETPEEKSSEDVTSVEDGSEENSEEYDEDEDYEDDYDEGSGIGKKILIFLLSLILLAGLAFGGYYCYNHFYLQNIDALTLQGDAGFLTVEVDSQIDDEKLIVVCTDTHGTRLEKAVEAGKAVFEGLSPNMLYNIHVEITGLHKLTGNYSDTYTTPSLSNILNFSALTGNEEGSVMLSFNVDGADSSSWIVQYAADGEDVKSASFSGHIVNITGLTLGKNYTFILDSEEPLFLSGETQLSYLVSQPVFAQDLSITGTEDNTIAVTWKAPENVVTGSWTVHCVSESGYDQTVTVNETTATFQGIDPAVAHTVEVIAEGMSSGTRTYMTANAVTITKTSAKANGAASITVSWNAPTVESQWVVVFSMEGSDKQENIRTSKTKATLTPVIPGATYKISVQLEDGTTVFGGSFSVEVPEAIRFNGKTLGLIAKNVDLDFSMCRCPEDSDWNRKDVKKDDYTTTFSLGEKAAFVVYVPSRYSTDDVTMGILYLIRDESGNMITYGSQVRSWRDMWKNRYCELEVPVLPDQAGKYTMEILFNGAKVHTQEFEIIAE